MELFSRGKARNKASLLPEPHQQLQRVTPSIRSHSLPPSMSSESPSSPGTHHSFLVLFEFFSCHSLLFHAFSPALFKTLFLLNIIVR
jgi:hypothetical protein